MSKATLLSPTDRTVPDLTGHHVRPAPPAALLLRFAGFGRFGIDADGPVTQLPPITNTVLARLLLARGGLVDAEALYQDAWPEPAIAIRREQRVAVHKRVAELRRLFDLDRGGGGRTVLLTDRSARTGYRLVISPDHVDLYRFEDLICRASAAQDAVAVELLTQALALWTERPLLGLPDKVFVRDAVARLTGLRARACRDLAAVCHKLDRDRHAIAVFDALRVKQPEDVELHRLLDQLQPNGQTPAAAPWPTPKSHALPAVWQVPLRVPDTVPRPDLLAKVRDHLSTGPIAMVGLLGTGKSRLAVEYAHQFAQQYTFVWWVDAQNPDRIAEQLCSAADQVGGVEPAADPAMAIGRLQRFLRGQPPGSSLLVFDNASDPAQVRPWLPDHGHVLITSRNPGWCETATSIEVGSFIRAQSVALLRGRLPEMAPSDADRLAHDLGDLPLAIAQAAAWLADEGSTESDYLRQFAAQPAAVAALDELPSYPMSISMAVRLAFEHVAAVDPNAAALLEHCLRRGVIQSSVPVFDVDVRRRFRLIARSGLARVVAGEVVTNRLIRAVALDRPVIRL